MRTTLNKLLTHPERNYEKVITALNVEILPQVLRQINGNISRHQIAKLQDERLPENERNLTDARTRIGVLLEYSLAIYLDAYWTRAVGPRFRIGFVVTNRFPDLTLRDPDHRPLLRLEIKCIQTEAEEKSANLDALIRDIQPHQDLLCVLVWEWAPAVRGRSAIEYPHIHRGFAFDAYTIAKVRDWGWLNEPKPGKTNDIDVTSAVVCQDNCWKKEEKNLGKLMRIADRNALERAPLRQFAGDANVAEYLTFKSYAIDLALRQRLEGILTKAGYTSIVFDRNPIRFDVPSRICAASAAGAIPVLVYFAGSLRWTGILLQSITDDLQSQRINQCRVVVMGEKFSWALSEYDSGNWSRPVGNKKPRPLVNILRV